MMAITAFPSPVGVYGLLMGAEYEGTAKTVSVPCRGLWFVNAVAKNGMAILSQFPSPVGVYGLLMTTH